MDEMDTVSLERPSPKALVSPLRATRRYGSLKPPRNHPRSLVF